MFVSPQCKQWEYGTDSQNEDGDVTMSSAGGTWCMNLLYFAYFWMDMWKTPLVYYLLMKCYHPYRNFNVLYKKIWHMNPINYSTILFHLHSSGHLRDALAVGAWTNIHNLGSHQRMDSEIIGRNILYYKDAQFPNNHHVIQSKRQRKRLGPWAGIFLRPKLYFG